MNIFVLILVLALVGLLLWAVNQFVPMPPEYKKFLNIAVIVILCILLITMVAGYVPELRIGK